ncbi:hypothetical protein [Bacteroides sp.]
MEAKKKITQMYNLEMSGAICLNIHVNKANKIMLGSILSLALIIFLIPISAFIALTIIGEGIHFGFILTCVIELLTSGYLTRLYLWNKYGKEVFEIQYNSLLLYYDYKFFKDNRQQYNFKSISVYSEYNGVLMAVSKMVSNPKINTETSSVICFEIDGKIVKSEGMIPLETIISIDRHISQWSKCLI